MPPKTTDQSFASIPSHYRFYTADASTEGRVRVMLALSGQDRDDWFACGEVLDISGKDIRPKLYASGIGTTLAAAIMEAVNDAI